MEEKRFHSSLYGSIHGCNSTWTHLFFCGGGHGSAGDGIRNKGKSAATLDHGLCCTRDAANFIQTLLLVRINREW